MTAATVVVTAQPGTAGGLPGLSVTALTELGVTALDPVELVVLVRSYGLDGTAPAGADELADELGLPRERVVELQALAATHAAAAAVVTPGAWVADDLHWVDLDDPAADLLAELDAELAAAAGLDVEHATATPQRQRLVDPAELTVLAGLVAGTGDADLAAAAGVDALTVTAYRLALPDLLGC